MNRLLASTAVAIASALVLVGCSAGDADGESGDAKVQVVASTNVYGSLAEQVGGDRVAVTSLIRSAAKDPHSYEASARDRLAVQRAEIVIENGGGYDSFMTELVEGSDAAIITAVEYADDFDDHADPHDADEHTDGADEHDEPAGEHAGHGHLQGFNEHVWFDLAVVIRLVDRIATDLAAVDPAGAESYEQAAAALTEELTGFTAQIDGLHAQHDGEQVFLTEPLTGRLATAIGLDDVAPAGFASAVEEGSDVAPAVLLDALRTLGGGEVRALFATAQTGGAETQRVVDAARQADVAIAEFSELLEPDQTYAEWMQAALDDLTAALR